MQAGSTSKGLTITNPLVLYRTLLATKRIEPDPAQHQFAIQLQNLYYRLKDYEPQIEYRHQLHRLTAALDSSDVGFRANRPNSNASESILSSVRARKLEVDTLALTRLLTDHESALSLQSPKGLLLHGEVGTGKSMLIDLLADSLPSSKKRRWHFNTFMLEAFAKLEKLRIQQSLPQGKLEAEHSLLWLAREMITTSPIIFLDEFQLPDRAASKILSSLFTSFFHLGGVLVASSNRMPEELIKASGIEFAPPALSSRFSNLKRSFLSQGIDSKPNIASSWQQSDFDTFLDVLHTRREVWDMEGSKDWRRHETDEVSSTTHKDKTHEKKLGIVSTPASSNGEHVEEELRSSTKVPTYYHLAPPSNKHFQKEEQDKEWEEALLRVVLGTSSGGRSMSSVPWQTSSLHVYGKVVLVPKHHEGVAMFSFQTLCSTILGPADYISVASSFHTVILTEVPILDLLHKNEARRFITLLGALYESKCKLLIRAEAGPGHIFFPETFSEIYQDQTSPSRPNVSSYTPSTSSPAYNSSPLSFSGDVNGSPSSRSILADEDSDFGPTYGAGQSSAVKAPDYTFDSEIIQEGRRLKSGPNFQQTGIFTGEDERFAYKRARSRLWECAGRSGGRGMTKDGGSH